MRKNYSSHFPQQQRQQKWSPAPARRRWPGCRRSCAGVAREATIRRPTRRVPAGSTLPSSSAGAMTTRRGIMSSATAIRPTPPSSTTAAAPRTPTLPDAPPISTAPTTMPTTRSSSDPSHPLLSVTSSRQPSLLA